MKKLIVVILIITNQLVAQPLFKKNVYRRTSKVIEIDFPKINPYGDQRLMQSKLLFSIYELFCIGDYKNSLSKYDHTSSPQFSFIDSLKQYKNTIDYYSIPAQKIIVEKAKNNRIVIINESHNQPSHRIFVKSLLQDLYSAGYRYFAIEALSSDSSLNQKKNLLMTDGYYTTEPQFSNMIKEAAKLGYTFVDYEPINKKELEMREYYQALHIKEKTFDKDSAAKILVYCGFGHGDETITTDSTSAMAGWLKMMIKIDPLTIDQESLTEHSSHDYEKTSYSFLNASTSSVFINKHDSTKTFVPFDGQTGYDLYVYHPRTIYKDKRPNWLSYNESHKYFITPDKIHIQYPLLIMAYDIVDKFDVNTPTDAIEIKQKQDIKPLILKSGKYTLLLRNNLKQEQTLLIEVK